MSHTHLTAASSSSSPSSSNFQLIFINALNRYRKRTKNNLLVHPLAAQLQACDSPTAIIAVLKEQVKLPDQSQSSDERWTKWLDPTVNVLYTFSAIIGPGVGMLFPPASVIFAGVGVLLSAAKDDRASQDTLFDIFERIERFFHRLELYTEMRPTTEMMEMIIQIMVEVLSILGIVTKEIKQGRIKKYAKKVIGRTDIEDALKRLEGLTHEEALMATVENLRATHTMGDSVREVIDTIVAIDDRMATGVDQMKKNQLRSSIHTWLSPPDPSTNHNNACGIHHKKTAFWLLQSGVFKEWKSTGSLLWIHGKLGSGKTVLCSTVIQNIESLCKAGKASMAYFYFDCQDANKRGLCDLVLSLLTQLHPRSGPRCDILSDLYVAHDEGKNQPSDSILVKCLKQILTLPDELPTYLIIDAIDESLNTFGIPSPREKVLQLVKELVELRLPHLHICVTSRPEIDVREVLEPLTSRRVSLHDQSGQKKDIEDYIKSVVYSNSEPIMKRWMTEDKELVIKVLSEKAHGTFRWVFYQLEVLRHCLPLSVPRTLDELPESLAETYERVLKEIKGPNQMHARRLLQCMVVAIRPFRVEELAQVLAVDFDDEEGIPKLNPNWRWEDHEMALLTLCPSLIAIVQSDESRIVQFPHISVKEFLTSDRLATSNGDTSRYHIVLELAHRILAQACMSVLLRSDDRIKQSGVRNSSPLAGYAAEYWVTHAQHEKVSSSLRKPMEYLFDQNKPYFAAWLQLHDIDTATMDGSTFHQFTPFSKTVGTPLYYAARCGFQDLVERLVVNNPDHVNAKGGYYLTPLVVALAAGHFQTAQFLRDSGADPNVRGRIGMTPLHSAAFYGEFKMVQVLLKFEADVNIRDAYGRTPLHLTLEGSYHGGPNNAQSLSNVARLLLEYGADANARWDDDSTPLHVATQCGRVDIVVMLLEHGVDVGAEDGYGRTALQVASNSRQDEIAKLLSERTFKIPTIVP